MNGLQVEGWLSMIKIQIKKETKPKGHTGLVSGCICFIYFRLLNFGGFGVLMIGFAFNLDLSISMSSFTSKPSFSFVVY
jgi:hypothetical protein